LIDKNARFFFWRQLGGKSIYDFKTYLLVSANKICTFAVLKHYTRTSIDIIIKNIEKHGSGLFY